MWLPPGRQFQTPSLPGEMVVLTLHAEGAQVYECKPGADGKLSWPFREPIATLLLDGKTVDHHYAGLTWEHSDSSAVAGKVVASAPGAMPNEIPWLKIEVTQRGKGILSGVTTVLRINTRGGNWTAHVRAPAHSRTHLTGRTMFSCPRGALRAD